MSTSNIGNPIQGRRLKSGNNGQEPIEIKASIGDGATSNSATPFLKFTGTVAATTDGDNNVTTADITTGGSAPGGTNKGILVDVGGVNYWVALYPVS